MMNTAATTEEFPITVGRFTFTEDGGLIGPADYMATGRVDELVDRLEAGTLHTFNMNPHRETHPIRSVLVAIQTDYAGWIGMRRYRA